MPNLTPVSAEAPGAARVAEPGLVRPEIQALRALAVALVVVYHYWPGVVRGGFVGVDVFFVISGFLITGHLVRTSGSPFWSGLFGFWARRARRLLPASLLVLLVTAIGVWVWVPRSLWEQFFSEIAASALYVQNWLLASNSVDYLAATNVPSPVQHYWSLSVEEQFYLVWPVLVLGTALVVARLGLTRQRSILATVLGILAAVSFGYGIFLTATNPSVAYFATTVRVWEFAAGGILAVIVPNVKVGHDAVRAIVSWAGLALIIGSALAFTGATPFPGVAAVVPVLGTLAVLWAGFPAAVLAPSRLFALRPVQFLGDISYSLYLWHFSLLVIGVYALATDNGLPFKLGVLAVAVVLAALSKRFVEDPVRRSRFVGARRPRRTFALAIAAMVVVVAVAGSGWVVQDQYAAAATVRAEALAHNAPACFGAAALAPGSGCATDQQTSFSAIVPAVDSAGAEADHCLLSDRQFVVRNTCDYPVAHATQTWALIGDSHAGAIAPAIALVAKRNHANLELFDHGHCPLVALSNPSAASDPVLAAACIKWNSGIQSYLRHHPEISRIFVTASAQLHQYLPGNDPKEARDLARDLASAWRIVPDSVHSIVVIKDVPRQSQNAVSCIDAHRQNYLSACSSSRSAALVTDPLELATKSTSDKRVLFLNLTNYLCTPTRCPVVVGGVLVYRDNQHLTTTYAETLAPFVAAALK